VSTSGRARSWASARRPRAARRAPAWAPPRPPRRQIAGASSPNSGGAAITGDGSPTSARQGERLRELADLVLDLGRHGDHRRQLASSPTASSASLVFDVSRRLARAWKGTVCADVASM
jgi:hypothetical protein